MLRVRVPSGPLRLRKMVLEEINHEINYEDLEKIARGITGFKWNFIHTLFGKIEISKNFKSI